MSSKFEIAHALRQIALLLRLRGERSFRTRAYERGAAAVEAVADLDRLIAEKRLTDLPGIGKALASVIEEIHGTGRSRILEELREDIPEAVLVLAQVPEIGLSKAARLHEALGVTTLAELADACEAGRVRELHGMGLKTEQKLLAAIRRFEAGRQRLALCDARDVAETLLDHVLACPATERAEIAGAVRRWQEIVDGVEIVVATRNPPKVRTHFNKHPLVAHAEVVDSGVMVAQLGTRIKVELHTVDPARYGLMLLRRTGPAAHVDALEHLAEERGTSLDALAMRSERDVYKALDLMLVPPELREGEEELTAAAERTLPRDLVTLDDIRGMIHCHTVYSDGKDTIEAMAREAESLGYSYITITDHSPAAYYAGGLGIDRIKQQWDEIAKVQERVKIRILRGTESDILADGSLDYPDSILEQLDVIIASVHARFQMGENEMTRRLVTAMRLPVFKIWGHGLGRLLLRRDPVACRVEEILDAAAESRAAIEINGDPRRLDLPPEWVRKARERDIRFVLSVDAHSIKSLRNLPYAVAMARRGWLRRAEVLNTRSADAFCAAVRPVG